MATAIIDGALGSGFLKPEQIVAYDITPESRAGMQSRGIDCVESLADIAACQYLLLAVKPQVAPQVLSGLAGLLAPNTTIISIVAGVTPASIAEYTCLSQARVVQVMPNTPIMVGEGATVLCRTATVGDADFDFAKSIFASAGVVAELPPDKMNESIAVHGSTPAYIYLIAKCFCEYAQGQGIPYETANTLFCQTLTGAAKMMTQTGFSHQQLIDMVTSPGGTTLAGLRSLEQANLKQIIDDCCDATIKRAYELGNSAK